MKEGEREENAYCKEIESDKGKATVPRDYVIMWAHGSRTLSKGGELPKLNHSFTFVFKYNDSGFVNCNFMKLK